MEFDTTRESFSFDAKRPGSDEDIRRSKIVDPGSPELVVNAVSQAAVSIKAPTISYAQNYNLENMAYPSINPQAGYGNELVPLSLMSPLSDGSGRFPCSFPRNETATWESLDVNFSNVQTLNETGIFTSIHAPADPTAAFENFASSVYALDGCSPGSRTVFADASVTQATWCTNPSTTSPGNDSLDANFFAPVAAYSFIGPGFFHGHPAHAMIPGSYIPSQSEEPFTGPNEPGSNGIFPPSLTISPISGLPSPTNPNDPSLAQPYHGTLDFQSKPSTEVDASEAVDEVPLPPPLPPQDCLMINFNSGSNPSATKHSRKPFTKAGKKKVHKVRVRGACVSCRARKLSCSDDDACEGCLKLVNNPALALHICVRTKLKGNYIGVRNLHESLDRRRARLEPLISSLMGPPIPIQLCVTSEFGRAFVTTQLNFQVMRCSSSPIGRWKRLEMSNGIYITLHTTDNERYVIVPSSLPTMDEFDTFGREVLLMQDRSHSGAITWHLDRFLVLYCRRPGLSRLRNLSDLTSRIASLNKLVAYGFVNLYDGSFDLLDHPRGGDDSPRFVSETVHDQIRLLAAKGLEPAEDLISSELDALKTIAGTSKHARIIAGICLLRLLLIYRDRSVRDEIRLSLPRNTNRHQRRLEKAAFFYKRLTISYSTICRDKDTPLTSEWEDEEGFEGNEQATTLRDAYLHLQPAFQSFCEVYLCRQHDDVFKDLIAKPLMAQKQRKRQKVGQ
ncbi:hypothetical protein IFR05_005259 [Cadophora sp. M221]|nr:hypothetical protein IFR05_005259 [Cadophora sp. M221]